MRTFVFEIGVGISKDINKLNALLLYIRYGKLYLHNSSHVIQFHLKTSFQLVHVNKN